MVKLTGTLDASGEARVQWQPYTVVEPDDDYVFKASVLGVWRKSGMLTVVHQAASATWSSHAATVGDTVRLRAQVRGVRDGETTYFTLFQKTWRGFADSRLDELQASASDGVAEAAWTIPEPTEAPARGDDGRRHLFFIAEASGVFATSDLLIVDPSEAVTQGEAGEDS